MPAKDTWVQERSWDGGSISQQCPKLCAANKNSQTPPDPAEVSVGLRNSLAVRQLSLPWGWLWLQPALSGVERQAGSLFLEPTSSSLKEVAPAGSDCSMCYILHIFLSSLRLVLLTFPDATRCVFLF